MKRWRPSGKSRVAMGEGTISINSSGMQPLEKSYSVNLSDVECILCCRKKHFLMPKNFQSSVHG